MAASAGPQEPQGPSGAPAQPPPDPSESLDAATEATRSLQGLSFELTARVPRLLEAMRTIGSGLDVHTVLDRIAETAAEFADARCAAIGVLDPTGGGALADVIMYGVPPADRDRIRELLADPTAAPTAPGCLMFPIRVQGELFGDLYLTDKRGGGEFSLSEVGMVKVLATEAGIAIGNARIYEATRQRERWIDGSVAVTTALLSGGDAEEALSVVAEQARRLAVAAAGLVLLPEEDGGLEIVAAAADDPAGLLGTVVPARSPIVPHLLGGEPVFVDDAATDPRMPAEFGRRHGPSMMLPLRSGDRVLGILATPRLRGDRAFSETERTLATQFADQAALALVLAEAQRDREQLAVYEDRDRIARDLHDLVIQRLFATGLMLESAQRRTDTPQEVREQVGRAVDELDATIHEVRTAIFALQQGPAEVPSGLRTRVLREIGTAAVPLGFQPSVVFNGPVDARVGELTAKNLIAALREALSNAFRHARAERIEVSVDATVRLPDGREGVRLTVADDGVGIPEGGRRSGLRNLAHRAEALGGSCVYGPGLGPGGGGTRVVWEAPL
ncbi:GAF domain-containing protein [Streptomyces sp. LX-29]|uniref:GAF domain-containing sensor histidine kinase n=1 Tax=Streptomyces sp. LX-29 TaxID=2900152 RepID=UPI00240D79DF|nr:GAF domain-containing protein [Streptomyces sp. LX-29]WFB08420.1 GAF domain-containing protein [Streptomyces sp. LX-29]